MSLAKRQFIIFYLSLFAFFYFYISFSSCMFLVLLTWCRSFTICKVWVGGFFDSGESKHLSQHGNSSIFVLGHLGPMGSFPNHRYIGPPPSGGYIVMRPFLHQEYFWAAWACWLHMLAVSALPPSGVLWGRCACWRCYVLLLLLCAESSGGIDPP